MIGVARLDGGGAHDCWEIYHLAGLAIGAAINARRDDATGLAKVATSECML